MLDALSEQTVNSARKSPILPAAAVLIATDGTPQSDAAVAITRQLPLTNRGNVKVLTVVDRAPLPRGAVDPSLVRDYERGLREEAHRKAAEQIKRLGDSSWTLEVRTGDPATVIAAAASESRARLAIVGLGGHGVGARFLGNETALRLMRLSETPVLAVDADLRALPARILVAMDFSEASIEAARLALEIAAPGATVTLVHVVPWERKEYIPEHWFREHEAYVGGQLKRVAGWLDSGSGAIHQKILYGKPGTSLLRCAEELDGDLIVAGTHGRGLLARMAGGQTVSKLVRGAGRSVLVLPAAAAFQRLDLPEQASQSGEQTDWAQKLDEVLTRASE